MDTAPPAVVARCRGNGRAAAPYAGVERGGYFPRGVATLGAVFSPYRRIAVLTGSTYTAVNRRLSEGRAQLGRLAGQADCHLTTTITSTLSVYTRGDAWQSPA